MSENKREDVVKELVRLILKATPDNQEKIINSLPDYIVKELRTRLNPTKKPVVLNTDEYIAMHYIDMDKRYKQRLLMTTIIGFLYRMLDEYEPPHIINKDLLSEDGPEFSSRMNSKILEFRDEKPKLQYTKLLNEAIDNYNNKGTGLSDIYKYKLLLIRHNKNLARNEIRLIKGKLDNLKNNKAVESVNCENNKKFLDEVAAKFSLRKQHDTDGAMERNGVKLTTADLALSVGKYEEFLNRTTETYETSKKRCDEIIASIEDSEASLNRLTEREGTLKKDARELKQEFMTDKELGKYAVELYQFPVTVSLNKLWCTFKIDKSLSDIDRDEYEGLIEQVKSELNIKYTKEEKIDKFKDKVEEFLNTYFKYNPDNHVRCGYYPNYNKDLIIPVKTQEERNKWEQLVKEYRSNVEVKHSRSVIPPEDTFFRINRYMENNYESLRQATDDIYNETTGIEHAFAPIKFFKGDYATVEKEYNLFKQKYGEELDQDLYLLPLGNWTAIDSWEENRDKVDAYTDKTEILKRVVERSKEDAKMGKKLMDKRAKKGGVNNPEFSEYLEAKGSKLDKFGVKRATDNDETSFIVNDSKLSDDKNEIELAIHHMAPVPRNKRRFRANMNKYNVNIAAETPEPKNTAIMTAQQYKKKLEENKKQKNKSKKNN